MQILQPNGHPCHKHIHHNKVTDTSAHHEQMKNSHGSQNTYVWR